MNRILYILSIILLFYSCTKKVEKNCSGDKCLGKKAVPLSAPDKIHITSKDTVYKFINVNNDTIIFRHRLHNSEPYVSTSVCDCSEKSTEISGECFYSIYTLDNIDLALKYSICSAYPNYFSLDIYFSDTNTVVHKIYKQTNPCSQFNVYNYVTKQNNSDSLNINGKYYYNIINTYDYVGICNSSTLNNVYYSKGFGIIKFNYNNFVYNIVN